MHTTIRDFLNTKLHSDPASYIGFAEAAALFRAHCGREASQFSRSFLRSELESGGYLIGKRNKRLAIAGLSARPPKQWAVVNGRLQYA